MEMNRLARIERRNRGMHGFFPLGDCMRGPADLQVINFTYVIISNLLFDSDLKQEYVRLLILGRY
jgi:hypothetical protein